MRCAQARGLRGKRSAADYDAVYESVLDRLLRRHEIVALGVAHDLLVGLVRDLAEYGVEILLYAGDVIGMDLDVRRLTLQTAQQRLVDHYLGVGQRESLARRACGEQERAHAGGEAYADGRNVRLDIAHGVVYRHSRGDGAAGAVDIKADVAVGILSFKIQKLCDDQRSRDVVYLFA